MNRVRSGLELTAHAILPQRQKICFEDPSAMKRRLCASGLTVGSNSLNVKDHNRDVMLHRNRRIRRKPMTLIAINILRFMATFDSEMLRSADYVAVLLHSDMKTFTLRR